LGARKASVLPSSERFPGDRRISPGFASPFPELVFGQMGIAVGVKSATEKQQKRVRRIAGQQSYCSIFTTLDKHVFMGTKSA
jgi:phosphotransferase system  glucose/maltose/N-acetylglucosamine-specific IIC component